LIPLLPQNASFLCIYLPGHGLSSRFPNGFPYLPVNNIINLNLICEKLKIEKISILAHSLGSILAFLFSSIFPEQVNMVIGMDFLKPFNNESSKIPEELENRFRNFIKADKRNLTQSEPPAYSWENLLDKLISGYHGSINKDVAPLLLKRNVKESPEFPGKYYFSNDSRIKYSNFNYFSQEVSLELAKRLQMPYLLIKSLNFPYVEKNIS
jgi:pimeloyl-ACP methyl ester carboxylesterase